MQAPLDATKSVVKPQRKEANNIHTVSTICDVKVSNRRKCSRLSLYPRRSLSVKIWSQLNRTNVGIPRQIFRRDFQMR